MLQFVRVEGAGPFFPHTCRCGSAQDLADTLTEDHTGRLYLCRRCVGEAARVFGMIEGERFEELQRADVLLEQARKEIAERDALVRAVSSELEALNRVHMEALEERAQLRGRVEQLEGAIREQAQQELALVGAGDAGTPVQWQGRTFTYIAGEEHDGGRNDNIQHEDGNAQEGGNTEASHEDQRDRSGEGDPED